MDILDSLHDLIEFQRENDASESSNRYRRHNIDAGTVSTAWPSVNINAGAFLWSLRVYPAKGHYTY